MVGNTRRLYTKDGRPFCAAEIEDLSGMVEVTVWPETFEQTQDLWFEGNILLMQVKVRDRNGRLQIAAQRVELYQTPDGTAPKFAPPTWATKVRKATPNGRATNGAVTEEPAPQIESPAQPSKAAAPPPSDAPRANGEPATAPEAAPTVPAPAPAASPPSNAPPPPAALEPAAVATTTRVETTRVSMLRIDLRESDDEDADRDRLERLLAALREYPGEDDVRLTVHTLGDARQSVALPKARACDELTSRLTEVLADAGEALVVEK